MALALASVGPLACSDQTQEDDLDSILKDGDLSFLNQSHQALTLAAPAGTGGSTGGGTVGSAGSVGSTDASAGTPDGGVATDGGVGEVDGGRGGRGGMGGGMGGNGGMGGVGGFGNTGGLFPQEAQGDWRFDDCSSDRSDLSDSSFNRHAAFRSVSTRCVEGINGQGLVL